MEKKETLKAKQTKERIEHAVEQLMQHKPLQNINIREICQVANVSIGTFYLYFPCKEAAVLYCYRRADEVFQGMELHADPLENIRAILDVYIHMVNVKDIRTVRELYICHIKYHDPYFFDEMRPVFIRLNEQIKLIQADDVISRQITMNLLTMARGLIFHLCCIAEESIKTNWHEKSINELMQYLEFELQKSA